MSRYMFSNGQLVPELEPPDCDLPEACAICGCPFYDEDSVFERDDGTLICTECAWLKGLLEYEEERQWEKTDF